MSHNIIKKYDTSVLNSKNSLGDRNKCRSLLKENTRPVTHPLTIRQLIIKDDIPCRVPSILLKQAIPTTHNKQPLN